jgi:hypothetical protein
MKKIIVLITVMVMTVSAMAQQKLSFPFQGGKQAMSNFFRDSITVSADIIQKKATGVAIFKFTADKNGTIKKVIVYYADDFLLTPPLIAALKKSNRKWIIPDHEEVHDFIIPFSVTLNLPSAVKPTLQKQMFDYYSQRKPILSLDQVPLDMATLLPTVSVRYDVK